MGQGEIHTPSTVFWHLPPKKDVVNQCLEFGRDHEKGGGAGPSREPRRDQEPGDGAGLGKLDNLLLQLFLNSCSTDITFVTLLRTAVETAIRAVHKLLGTGGVPTSLTLLFLR